MGIEGIIVMSKLPIQCVYMNVPMDNCINNNSTLFHTGIGKELIPNHFFHLGSFEFVLLM